MKMTNVPSTAKSFQSLKKSCASHIIIKPQIKLNVNPTVSLFISHFSSFCCLTPSTPLTMHIILFSGHTSYVLSAYFIVI